MNHPASEAPPCLPMATLPEAARTLMERIGPIWGTDLATHRELVLRNYTPLLAINQRLLAKQVGVLQAIVHRFP